MPVLPNPAPTSPSAETKVIVPQPPAFGHSGILYQFSFSQWNVFNGSPLAYTPFEVGYDFGNGLRLQTGYDIFYYTGMDQDPKNQAAGLQEYSYQMSDWRSSAIYRVPLPLRVRPLTGISLDVVGGSRRLSPDFEGGKDINATAPSISAWGFFGTSVLAGLELLLNPDWNINVTGRYTFTFNEQPSPTSLQMGLMVVF
jgi:hypothetical protein